MWIKIPPKTEYMPKYDGWWVTQDKAEVIWCENNGKPLPGMSQLIMERFYGSVPAHERIPATRDYTLYVWRPGAMENEFGPISP